MRLQRAAIAFAVVALMALVVGTARDRLRYSTERVSYSSDDGTGSVALVATVYRPRGGGPFPVVSLVQGSERTPRDRYHAFAERFVREGYLVVLADRRGVGESSGEFTKEVSAGMLNTLATDVTSSLRYVVTRHDVDTTRIGVFGVSQAGWVIPLVAPRSPRLAFAIIMSGPVPPAHLH
ncbi:MAG: CocE/NonD family hydrolase [Gemmatimonadaceae bacterium]